MKRGEISPEFRAALWAILFDYSHEEFGGDTSYSPNWCTIMQHMHVRRYHKPIDKFMYSRFIQELKHWVFYGAYYDVLGLLEFILKHHSCPSQLAEDVSRVMEDCQLGYRWSTAW